ncbi:DUF3413 domain-containing protein [Vreelandella boliviensis]|uniref:DUF3413 domain-containing protein n=1 Tax=Vreelandella boliviensis TaxID=223527 RepID=UPI001B8C262E|nr:DUF3413 domain-containing protein [Halomonas boliviensis]MBS3666369.1 DUF3413 domain-containing protein [Halomonas boliviensis]
MHYRLLHRWRWLGAWTLANLLLTWMISLRYVGYIQPEGAEQWGYLLMVFLGHLSLLVWLGALPMFLLATLLRGIGLWLMTTLWASGLQLLLLLDTFVYAQYRFHLSGFILDLLLNAGGDVFSFSWVAWALTVGGVLGMLAVQGGLGLLFRRRPPSRPVGAMLVVSLLALLGVHGWHAWADAHYDRDITGMTRHVPVFYPATAKRFFAKQGWVDPQAVRDRVDLKATEGKAQGLVYPSAPLSCSPSVSSDNLLLVLVDALRHDMLTPEVMPNLYRYASQPGWFRAREHISGGNSTKAGVFSLFYGLPVTYWDAFTASQTPPVLMEQFEAADYRFQVLSSATLVSPAFDRNVFAGLKDVSLKPAKGEPWERDQQITDDWLAWMDKEEARSDERPFFGFLFYDAVHGYSHPPDFPRFTPYWEHINHMSLGPGFDPEPYWNRYRTAARYVDQQLGRVLDDLERRGRLEDTAIVITADHGESFNEHGKNYWGHGSNYTPEQVQVPLVMHLPGLSGGALERRTHHADIAPTLLEELLDCESAPQHYTLGQSLLDADPHRDWMLSGSYMGYGILMPDYQVAVHPTGAFEVYDYRMNELDDIKLEARVSNEVLRALSRFYR